MAILTISREYGSGGRAIGRLVAERLDYKYIDKELLFEELKQVGERWGRAARELDEVCPTVWERYDWEYRGYVAQVEALIMAYAAQDKVVIIGRGGSFLLKDVPFCLRVRLVAPLEVRIEQIMLRESLDRIAAERLIKQVDGDRACFIKANYGVDWDSEEVADMTINTASLTYEQVAEILVEGLINKDRLATSEARERLKDKALAYRLKARIAADPRILIPTLEVKLADGDLVITGIIHIPKEMRIVEEIAREVCGDRPVRFDLHHRV